MGSESGSESIEFLPGNRSNLTLNLTLNLTPVILPSKPIEGFP